MRAFIWLISSPNIAPIYIPHPLNQIGDVSKLSELIGLRSIDK